MIIPTHAMTPVFTAMGCPVPLQAARKAPDTYVLCEWLAGFPQTTTRCRTERMLPVPATRGDWELLDTWLGGAA